VPRSLTPTLRRLAAGLCLGVSALATPLVLRAQSTGAAEQATLGGFVASVWDGIELEDGGRSIVVALTPARRRAGQRFPLLIALHGLGETLRGADRGAWGWALDYALPRGDEALRRGSLQPADLEGLVTTDRLRTLNASLGRAAYEGVVVLLPFTPDVRGDLGGPAHRRFERWLLGPVLARARRELPVRAGRESTGIDGVSLGGLHALWTGLAHPEVFGVVGAIQPAVRRRASQVLARFSAGRGRPSQRIRLVTSTRDALRDDVLSLDRAMSAAGIDHEVRVLEGPHDYVFNRGPGSVEMLLFHDRALRGLTAP
jgi:enterochelin esterase-like enzyme